MARDRAYDLRTLEVFLKVCETGSMTAAAEALGLTQSAVSQLVKQLEQRLGAQLFDRDMRPLRLTGPGGVLSQRARRLLAEARQIAHAVRQTRDGKMPEIRIGLIDSFSALFGPALAEVLQRHTRRVTVWSGLSLAHGEALLRRDLDLIITSDPLEDVEALERHRLWTEPFVALAPRAMAADGETLDPAQWVERAPLVRYTARSHLGMLVERYLRLRRIDPARGLEFDTTEALAAMVVAGAGWAITTPLCQLQARHWTRRLSLLALPETTVARRLTLVARTGELGNLPAEIALQARSILARECLPALRRQLPWCDGLMVD